MKYVIDKENASLKIKDFLRKEKISTALLKRIKKLENGILVNGKHENVLYILKVGDVLEIDASDNQDDTNKYLNPVNLPIEIIYEDENITVVNKSGNMPTHQSLNNHDNTLANALMYRYKDKPYVFRAVNRLDKDTSGVVLTANNRYYASLLSGMIKKHEIEKVYIALVNGRLDGTGTINAPIERIQQSIIKREVREDGESAVTEYEVIKSCDEVSLVLLYPKTGRTHQLRVHMSHIGHPIIGDKLYFKESEYIDRQALHCLRMTAYGIGSFFAKPPEDILNLVRRYFGNEEIIPKN